MTTPPTPPPTQTSPRPTAVVTGASSGIGLELARLLAADGHDLVLVARGRAELDQLAGELNARHGTTAHVLPKDLSLPSAPREIADELRDRGTNPDVLVNNAGFGAAGPFVEADADTVLSMLQVNVVTLTHLARLLLPGMVSRGRGRVLNVASMAAFQPGPLMAVYYASKAYVLSFSEAIADELRGTGVTVTALCPGPTRTAFDTRAGAAGSLLFSLGPMTPAAVAKAGYHGMRKGRRVVIPGLRNWMMYAATRAAPRRLATAVARKLNRPT